MITSYIIGNYCTDQNPCKILQGLLALLENGDETKKQDKEKRRAARILELYQRFNGFDDSPKAFSYAISRIDNIGNFLN